MYFYEFCGTKYKKKKHLKRDLLSNCSDQQVFMEKETLKRPGKCDILCVMHLVNFISRCELVKSSPSYQVNTFYRIYSQICRFQCKNSMCFNKTNDSVEALDPIEAFLNSLTIPKLSEEQRQSCVERITTEECRTIIETFQNNKSPGNDGLPIEFYKSCWDLISESFRDCVNESFDKEEMSNSQRQAVITEGCPILRQIYAWHCIVLTSDNNTAQKHNNKERSKTIRNLTMLCINLSEYWTSM